MIGIPDSDTVAQLVALSIASTAEGPPPMVDQPIVIDEAGFAYGFLPGEPDTGVMVHAGVRLGWTPVSIQGGVLLAFLGGHQADPGYGEEGIIIYATPDGLRRLAGDLVAIADAVSA